MQTPDDPLHVKLNGETGKLTVHELERHLARGAVVKVAAELDLVYVAARMANDDTRAFQTWMAAGQVSKATMDDARDWHAREAVFWAVVVAPWVLVQETPAVVS